MSVEPFESWDDLRRENRRLRIEVGLLRREKAALEVALAHVVAERGARPARRWWWRR